MSNCKRLFMENVIKCQMFWQLLLSFEFSQFFANFGIVWLFFVSCGNFLHIFFGNFCHVLAILSNFCHVLAAFDNFGQIWLFFVTVGKFKPLLADFGIFLAAFGCSHKLLATFMNFLSLKSTVATFWQFLSMSAIFLAILGRFWTFLETFASDVTISPCHQAI